MVAENQAFLNGLKGYTDAWIHFSNVTELNQQQFDDFKSKAIDAYKQLQTQGFTSSQALKEIAPMLKRLQLLQHDFGLQVDDTTQGLIDQADSKGYLEELNEPMGEMVKILQDIADLLGNAFPAAAKQAGEAIQYHFKKARGTMDDFNDSAKSGARYTSKGGVSAGDEVGGYAGGTQGWEPQPDAAWVGEDGPEFVRKRGNLCDLTPAGNRQTVDHWAHGRSSHPAFRGSWDSQP